ncbi:MAG: hypothetical protein AB1345_14600 [Chloroflexota bacterium]
MKDKDDSARPKRQYPPFYERVVPIVLGIIVIAIFVLLFLIVGVALGWFPGGR